MPFDSSSYTEQIANEVGDPNGTVADLLDGYWTRYFTLTKSDVELTYLYVKRAALQVRLAEEVESTDIAIGQDWQDKQSERFAHIQAMYDETHAELMRLITVRNATGIAHPVGVVTGRIAASSIGPDVPPFAQDANNPRYRGSPYRFPFRGSRREF